MYENLFQEWLEKQSLSTVSKKNYLRGIRYIKKDLPQILTRINVGNIYEIEDMSKVDIILNNDEFISYDRKGNRMCSSGLKKYKEFLMTIKNKSIVNEESYRLWMQKNTKLIPKTIGSYISALKSLREPLRHHSETEEGLDVFKIHNFDKISKIMDDEKFILIDKKWNQAHTAALKYYKKYLLDIGISKGEVSDSMKNEDVVLIKIGQSYKPNMTTEELYSTTSISWVVKLEGRPIKYFCAVVDRKIIEVYLYDSSELDTNFEAYITNEMRRTGKPRAACLPPSGTPRYILHGELADDSIRQQLIGLDVSDIHGGKGNPIKYTMLETLLNKVEAITQEKNMIGERPGVFEISEIPTHIHTYLTSKGFLYSEQNIKNLYLSLRSKPFVILSGISGTGKTKVVQLFAEAIGATQGNGRFQLIPVRPDWSDSSDLLGYTDLKGDFVKGQLTEMIIRAAESPSEPHFVVLDEMNLARVEYYLSEYLSVIESRERQDDRIETALLVRVDGKVYGLPDNLYIIGTVNMDETTYPFSKKVLDRANSIEFNEINLASYQMLMGITEEVSTVNVHNSQFVSKYVYLKEAYPQHEGLIVEVSEYLEKMNQHLQLTYAQIGYRVRDEICFYIIYNEEMALLNKDEAMDFCVMQKILPRISGAGSDVEDVLKALFRGFAGVDYVDKMAVPSEATYPQSARKVQEMLSRLNRQGFTSFWVS